MANSEQSQQSGTTTKRANGDNGSGDSKRKTVVRAAAIAAASGATALAAKKVIDRDQGTGDSERKSSGSGDASVMSSVVGSAWDSAKDSLVPMMEDAAGSAGEYLGRSAPELVRETLVPAFITGFERASKNSEDDH